MEIIHEEINGRGIFYIKDDNGKFAELTYRRTPDNKIVADHTWVSPEREGQGIARKLFDKLVEFVRNEKAKLVPLCSYVVRTAEKEKEKLKDILTKL